MKSIIILIVLFSYNFTSSAQNGYNIFIKTNLPNDTSLVLSYYGGSNAFVYPFDTISTINKKAIFTQSHKIKGGIYRLAFINADKNDYLNIAIENGASIDININDQNILNSTSTDKLTNDFIAYQQPETPTEHKISQLDQYIRSASESTLALYAKLELLDYIKETIAEKDKVSFQKNYFNGIDLNDKRIELLPNSYTTLFDFVNLRPITVDNYNEAIDIVFSNQQCGDNNYNFYINWFAKNIYYYNKYRINESFNHLINTYLVNNSCYEKEQKLYDNLQRLKDRMEENPVGSTLPDFEMKVVSNDSVVSFYDKIKDKTYTLFALYDPECSHCQETMPKLAKAFAGAAVHNPRFQVITLCNAEPSREVLLQFIDSAGMHSLYNTELGEPIFQFRDKTQINSNPTFYLINSKGEILIKGYNEREILKEIQE